MNRNVLMLATLLFCTLASVAIGKSETLPRAVMKAQYTAIAAESRKENGDTFSTNYQFILQIAPGYSYYYNPRTYYVDSLEHDPAGRKVLEQITSAAFEEFMRSGAQPFKIMEEKGVMQQSRTLNRKNFAAGVIDVWDSTGGDKHHYTVPMDDIKWEILDSTKTVMGYECQLAEADYHGRKWYAWFAQEIPVTDGPWQLCGLPGLILEAETADKLYSFEINGLEKCDEPLKEPFDTEKYYNSDRIAFLKVKAYGRNNRSAQINAMTGGKVNINMKQKEYFDLIETDYN